MKRLNLSLCLVLVVIFELFSVSRVNASYVLEEHYDPVKNVMCSDNNGFNWIERGQTFTPQANQVLTRIKSKLQKGDDTTYTGDLEMRIYNTLNGLPNGSAIGLAYHTADDLIYNSNTWIDFVFGGINLTGNTKYAFTIKYPNSDLQHSWAICWDQSTPTYGGGTFIEGPSWSEYYAMDLFFYTFSAPPNEALILDINSPVNFADYQNPVNFRGSAIYADYWDIYYTTDASSTASTTIWTNINGNFWETPRPMYWDFEKELPVGYLWIKTKANNYLGSTAIEQIDEIYVAEGITPTTTASTTIILENPEKYFCDNMPKVFWDNATTCPTSTSIIFKPITNIANIIFDPINALIQNFRNWFSNSSANYYGELITTAILQIKLYGQGINQIFNFPIFEILVLLITANLGIFLFKAIWYAIKLIR